MLSEELKQAVALIKSGKKQEGGQLLAEILKADPDYEMAWLWMSLTVTTKQQRRHCLEKVLVINPNNEQARQALAELEGQDHILSKARPQVSSKTGIPSRKPQPTSSVPASKPLAKDPEGNVSYNLGTPMGEWKGKSSGYIWSGLGIILGMIIVCVSLNVLASKENSGVFLCIFGLGTFGYSLFVGVKAFIERDWQVQVFSEGLVQTKRAKHTIIRWPEIVAVWQNVTNYKYYGIFTYNTTHRYTIQFNNNQKLRFDDSIKNVAELGNMIQKQVTKHQLPSILKALENGRTIPFGKLLVSSQGLSNGKETIPWGQVQSVRLDRGIITIKKQEKWLNWSSIRVAETPNIFVFLTLVDTIVGIK